MVKKHTVLERFRRKIRTERMKERMAEAVRARSFTAAETLEMGFKLIDFARDFSCVKQQKELIDGK